MIVEIFSVIKLLYFVNFIEINILKFVEVLGLCRIVWVISNFLSPFVISNPDALGG
jgi:hypothetical protein